MWLGSRGSARIKGSIENRSQRGRWYDIEKEKHQATKTKWQYVRTINKFFLKGIKKVDIQAKYE